ncbi:uncharacterized protein LOC118766643 [Octopus sinensis]|uniref:Uncharacterized protein LOC118766643 n=1 Tax=Octopus sinensis TaxID=2607531 RepID=A0A7E6FEV8_9MOLL|nr:uncharacterized protein LOC118766643 [Octopus sinensis]
MGIITGPNSSYAYRNDFIRVRNAYHANTPDQNISATLSYCIELCWGSQECKSFAYNNDASRCLIYSVTSEEKLLLYHANTHYYQKKKNYNNIGTCPLNIVYRATSEHDYIVSKSELSLPECLSACYDNSSCNIINYSMKNQHCAICHTNSLDKSAIFTEYRWQVIYVNRTRLLSVPKHQLMSLYTMGCNP